MKDLVLCFKICCMTYATTADLSFHLVIKLHTNTNDDFRTADVEIRATSSEARPIYVEIFGICVISVLYIKSFDHLKTVLYRCCYELKKVITNRRKH